MQWLTEAAWFPFAENPEETQLHTAFLLKYQLHDSRTTEPPHFCASYGNFRACKKGLLTRGQCSAFANAANVMCCFEDTVSHLADKVENSGEEKKWAVPKFFVYLHWMLFCAG